MPDQRTAIEKKLDALIGRPLYYCSECQKSVSVSDSGIKRPCGKECGHEIIAPRTAIVSGDGGLNFKDSCKMKYRQVAALLTGRCV